MIGGAGGNRTPVRQHFTFGSTCLAVSIELTISRPTGRVLQASHVMFDRIVHNVRCDEPVLYDSQFEMTDIL